MVMSAAELPSVRNRLKIELGADVIMYRDMVPRFPEDETEDTINISEAIEVLRLTKKLRVWVIHVDTEARFQPIMSRAPYTRSSWVQRGTSGSPMRGFAIRSEGRFEVEGFMDVAAAALALRSTYAFSRPRHILRFCSHSLRQSPDAQANFLCTTSGTPAATTTLTITITATAAVITTYTVAMVITTAKIDATFAATETV
jgi:hypothetical protein